MKEPCRLAEGVLIDYIHGSAPAELCRTIERSPGCLAAARRLAAELLLLRRLSYRASCPDEETLIDYQERRLQGTEQLVVRQHVLLCALCQEEYQQLEAIDAVPLTLQPGKVRHFFEAVFQPPLKLSQPVRGHMLHYRIPHLSINLSSRRVEGRARSWTLRGQVRSAEGQQVVGTVEAVVLRMLERPEQRYEAQVESNGSFVVRGLEEGAYSLTVTTAEEEILIRQLVIGDER